MKSVPSFVRAATARARPTGIPQEFLLRDLKEKRKFRLLSRKLLVFVTFVIIYLSVLLMDRNISGRSTVQRIVTKELLTTPRSPSQPIYSSITSIGAFWEWFTDSFMVSVYSTKDVGGYERREDEGYTVASHTVIVGGFQMLQTRYAALNFSDPANIGSRCYSELEPLQNQTCYSDSAESTEPFGSTNGSEAELAELQALEMFSYSTDNDSARSGYQTFFLRSETDGREERERVARMRKYRWLDRQTKEVTITMPLYNYNMGIWSIVHLTVNFDLAGGVLPQSTILVINLDPYDLNVNSNILRCVLEGIFVAHVIYFILLELWDICVLSGGSYTIYVTRYGLLNNIGDWINIIVNVLVIGWRYLSQNSATRKALLALTTFDEYVDPLPLIGWDRMLLGLNLLNILLFTGRSLKYFQVTKGGRRLMRSVYGAMPEVMSFLPIYFSIIVGYSFAGHMLYGMLFSEWSTFPRSFFRVFEINFGLYDPGPIYDQGGIFSAIFIYSANIVFCILMLNVFMAIVMSTWDRLSEKEEDRANEREQYSRIMGFTDALFLLVMQEDHVDALIDVALDLEGETLITRARFMKAWEDIDCIDVPEWTTTRVLGWYWDRDDVAATASGIEASTRALSMLGKAKSINKALGAFGGPAKAPGTNYSKADGLSPKKYMGRAKAPGVNDDEPVEIESSGELEDPSKSKNSGSGATEASSAFGIPSIPWSVKPPSHSSKVAVDNSE